MVAIPVLALLACATVPPVPIAAGSRVEVLPWASSTERILIRYADSPDPALLATARAEIDPVVLANPRYTYGRFLSAYVAHLGGDTAAETAAIEPLLPENRVLYAFLFHRPDEEVATLLRCNQVDLCRLKEEGEWANRTRIDPLRFVKEGTGTVSCGGNTVTIGTCSDAYEVLGRMSWVRFGENRLDLFRGDRDGRSLEDFGRILGVHPGSRVAGRSHHEGPMMGLAAAVYQSLKPGGTFYIADYYQALGATGANPGSSPVVALMEDQGFRYASSVDDFLPDLMMLAFERPQ